MRCADCWHSYRADDGDLECWRFPPQVVPAHINPKTGEVWISQLRPSTEPDEYCGEYTGREP